jgi:cytidine deaminase
LKRLDPNFDIGGFFMEYAELAGVAIGAMEMSYSPYSGFRVGAALLAVSGKVYTGCNIESAAYSPTNCAERTALFKAVSEGEREFLAIAVAGAPLGGEPQYCYPCGVCRQMLNEFFGEDTRVIVVKSEDDYKVHDFGEILPFGFGAENLGRKL